MLSRRTDLVLARMPYGEIGQPSLALGLLKSCAERQGLSCQVIPANLWFAEQIGPALHDLLFQSYSTTLVGEWTFSGVLFPGFEPADRAYLEKVVDIFRIDGTPEWRYLRKRFPGLDMIEALRAVRQATTDFVEHVATSILAHNPRVVGVSSTFQQHCASLALLRRIKDLRPEVVTMIGGANCEERMGALTFQRFPFLDFVASGEADGYFGPLCATIVREGPDAVRGSLPTGLWGPEHRAPQSRPAEVSILGGEDGAPIGRLEDMDESPLPNYDDYFSTLEACTGLGRYMRPALPFQTARGCWWGEKNHCSFCGISRTAMKFRAKSADNVIEQMVALRERYGISTFQGTEYIFDYRFFETLLPRLAEFKGYFRFEVKANLKPEQIEAFIAAGVLEVQPGVESLQDDILKALRKGTTAYQNLLLLRRGRSSGLSIYWNLLHSIPNAKDEWYGEMAQLIPLVTHLQPPVGFAQVHYDRFSPYWKEPEKYGLELRPAFGYEMVYPFLPQDLWDIAYFFETQKQRDEFLKLDAEQSPGLQALTRAVGAWRSAFNARERATLSVYTGDGESRFKDSRAVASEPEFTLRGLQHEVYQACLNGQSFDALYRLLERDRPGGLDEAQLRDAIEGVLQRKVVAYVSGRYLSLAVEGDPIPLLCESVQLPMEELNPTRGKLMADRYLDSVRPNRVVLESLTSPAGRLGLNSWLKRLAVPAGGA